MKPFATASRSSELYGSVRWKRARSVFLRAHRYCLDCMTEQRTTIATVVDHDPPHRGDEAAFWDESTWRPLCWPHHQAKTGREIARRFSPRREAERHPGEVSA